MRLCDILLEAKIPGIEKLAEKLDVSEAFILSFIKDSDPTGGKLKLFIYKLLRNGSVTFTDSDQIRSTLELFEKHKQRLDKPNIFDYDSLEAIKQAINSVIKIKRLRGIDVDPETLPGVSIMAEQGPYVTYKIIDPGSLMKMGIGTSWCTREDYPNCRATFYLEDKDFVAIIVRYKGGVGYPIIQFNSDLSEMKDSKNADIAAEGGFGLIYGSFNTKQDTDYLLNLFLRDDSGRILSHIIDYCRYNLRSRWIEFEKVLIGKAINESLALPDYLLDYAVKVVRDIAGESDWPEGEAYIVKNLEYHKQTAESESQLVLSIKKSLDGDDEYKPYLPRSPIRYNMEQFLRRQAERSIGTRELRTNNDAIRAALEFATIFEKRIAAIEPYLISVLKSVAEHKDVDENESIDSFSHARANITSSCADLIYSEYIRDVIKGRWPEVEPYIAKCVEYSVDYALLFKHGPWRTAEYYLLRELQDNSGYAYEFSKLVEYSIKVLEARWLNIEPYILSDNFKGSSPYKKYKSHWEAYARRGLEAPTYFGDYSDFPNGETIGNPRDPAELEDQWKFWTETRLNRLGNRQRKQAPRSSEK